MYVLGIKVILLFNLYNHKNASLAFLLQTIVIDVTIETFQI